MPERVDAFVPYTGLLPVYQMCRRRKRLSGETVAVCTRATGHKGKHWMEAPAFPRIAWRNREAAKEAPVA